MESLMALANGAVIERIEDETRAVLENILDPNTDAEAVRKITATFSFKPDEKRRSVTVEVAISSKTAAATKVKTMIFIGHGHDGEPIMAEDNPTQTRMEFQALAPAGVHGE
jgi:ectoine hydroxylase-related dioxygenase (phytanoyl-CoA dioxygenase family)